MDIEILINNIVQTFILPPGISIVLMVTGLVIIQRFYATGKLLLIFGFLLLIILSLPITAQGLNLLLEQDEILTKADIKKIKAKAIIVLGAGRYRNAIEYSEKDDAISKNALERLKYAVYIHKISKIPLLVSGGSPHGRRQSEASIMQTTLKDIFNLKAKWLDPQSPNTWHSARNALKILNKDKNKSNNILLVTHAIHMQRSKMAFEHYGFKVTPAPLGFKAKNKGEYDYTILDFLPSAGAMDSSSSALHEYIGYVWYVIRYQWFGNE